MTSSTTGRNGLPGALGNDPEPQIATATPAAPTPIATATATTAAPANDSDSHDAKSPAPAPASASDTTGTLAEGSAVAVADPPSSSATSAPASSAVAASAPTPAPDAPSTASSIANSGAPVPKAATPTLDSAPASQPPPSTPPPRLSQTVPSAPPFSAVGADSAAPRQQQSEAPPNTQALPPVDTNSTDHPMPDAHAPSSAGAIDSVDPQQQSTPMQAHLAASTLAEHFAPSTPFTTAPMPTIDQHAYMMMALASMSGAPTAMSPPPTVTPSQVTLPNSMEQAFHGLAPANSIRQANADKALESFARIEFADSVFQMTTYAVIIGRDQRALEQARRDEKRADDYRRRVEENATMGLPPPSPNVPDRSKFSKSYVSEEGGMLGPESDNGENGRPAKRRKTSTQGSSQHDNDEAAQAQENMISNRQYVSHTPGAAAVDLTSLRPSPFHVPFIGIHSPGPNIASKTKAISREHLKIAYNQDEGVFEAIPLHKNGFFCEDVHYKSEKVVLRCGDRLQIKDIDFRFMINGVERGRTGAEEDAEEEPVPELKKRHAHGGKEMSFDFESSHANGEVQDTSDELSEVASPPELSDFGEEDEAEDVEPMETVEAEAEAEKPAPEAEASVKQESLPQPQLIPQIPKKRGPGRPPKNGVMSKREQRLLKKQQQEMAKKTLPQAPPVEPPIKRKVGRPRKHPLPETGSERPEKRKYKPRKPKGEDGAEGSDAERRAREKKEKKARPKSPPLELKIEDYTEEQLQKPNKNYGVLIDETLTAAGPDGLTLKQIYKRICQRYPWFYFHTETKGWESSVRHNLIGNEAFRKDETTNLWSRVPGVELDAGKKRKASSPDRSGLAAAQAYSQYPYPYNATQQHMAPGVPGYAPGQAPPAYPVPAYNAQHGQPGRPVQPYGASASPPAPGQPAPGQPAPAVASQPPAPAQLPPGYGPPPAPARPQLGAPQPGTYSSPYAPRPPPPAAAAANPPVKTEDGHATSASAPPQQAPVAAAKSVAVPGPVAHHAAAAPATRPPAAPAAAVPSRPVIEPPLLQAVVNLKNGLVENLKKARNPKAEGIVMSALNRCIGLKKEATENEKMESICIKGICQVVEGFLKSKKSPTPGPAASASPSATGMPAILDAKVVAGLAGFKDVSIKALKDKLGEAKAEVVTLSAIDRVLGLADASIVPPAGEGESGGSFEGLEQHLMKSIRQLLTGMNHKV
ncbi:hypothetical protein FDECE_2473 [Fusarium decemcellulare]|nr:hypothetical protein FDECE_2473 [Fusarium decemcellulare]